MKEIPIRFKSLTDLSDFATVVGYRVFLLRRFQLVLTGQFTDAEIELAISAYDATIESPAAYDACDATPWTWRMI